MKEKPKAMNKQNEKTVILYFPSASDTRPLCGKQGLTAGRSCSGRLMPSQWEPPFSSPSPAFIAEHDAVWHGLSPCLVQLSCASDVLSPPLAHLVAWWGWRPSLDTVPALPRDWGATNTLPVTSAKHSTMWDAVGKLTPSQPDLDTWIILEVFFPPKLWQCPPLQSSAEAVRRLSSQSAVYNH